MLWRSPTVIRRAGRSVDLRTIAMLGDHKAHPKSRVVHYMLCASPRPTPCSEPRHWRLLRLCGTFRNMCNISSTHELNLNGEYTTLKSVYRRPVKHENAHHMTGHKHENKQHHALLSANIACFGLLRFNAFANINDIN